MTRINLYLLGSPQIEQDNRPLEIQRQKTLALLIYLAVTGQTHRRDSLATLFWPDLNQSQARAALTRRLSEVRKILGEDTITVTREIITVVETNTLWLDVKHFQQLVDDCVADSPTCLQALSEAAQLYRDDFLTGFTLPDCPEFDAWQRFQSEELRYKLATVLDRLIELHRQRNDAATASSYARRRLAFDPLHEPAHRTLMRLYVAADQQADALRQYQYCVQLLDDELGVPPAHETTALYERIRTGALMREAALNLPPQWVKTDDQPTVVFSQNIQPDQPLVLARERELAQLDDFLTQAIKGSGRVVFVTGEAGRGKTTLVQAFTRQAQAKHPYLMVAQGNCDAYMGHGDPYLPFRELLNHLTTERKVITEAIQALVTQGPDLIGIFVTGATLLQQAKTLTPAGTDWLTKLAQLVDRSEGQQGVIDVKQINLFQQVVRVLEALAQTRPLLLVLDDLHWADGGSIELLFHVGRRLANQRILIVGTYRPEDVGLGYPASSVAQTQRHPLEPVINEFQRIFGANYIDLQQAAGQMLVEKLIDREPNRLGASFREALYQHTQGHALFTIEVLREMQARGDLIQDDEGCWVEGTRLQWTQLPARVEGVIGERIGRLEPPLRQILQVASVMGETFTAEVVAQVLKADVRQIAQQLGDVLDKQHHLVRSAGGQRLGGQRLSQFRFQHSLFQSYLYTSLSESQRVYWHEDVGLALEGLYGMQTEDLAGQLAHHFQEADLQEKALNYLQQAGQRAMHMAAYAEAGQYFSQAMSLLLALPENFERDQQEFTLQFNLGQVLATKGFAAPEVGEAYSRALALARQLEQTDQIIQVLYGLSLYALGRSELALAQTYGQECLRLATESQDSVQLMEANKILRRIAHSLGQHGKAVAHGEQVVAFYRTQRSSLTVDDAYAYALALAGMGLNLVPLGYPDRALEQAQEGLTLVQNHTHHFGTAHCLGLMAYIHLHREDWPEALYFAKAAINISNTYDFAQLRTFGQMHQGIALVRLGDIKAGITLVKQGIAEREAMEVTLGNQTALARLAEACGSVGRVSEGLALINGVVAHPDIKNDHQYEPKLYQIKGDLLLLQDLTRDELPVAQQEAEVCFRRAIEIAQSQGAKLWEARALASLCRLHQSQGRAEGCRQQLADLYTWFTEGFETEDLRIVQAVLQETA